MSGEAEAERLLQELGKRAPQYLVDRIFEGVRQNRPETELQALQETLVIVQERLAAK